MDHCVFLSLEWALYIYSGNESTSKELLCCIITVAEKPLGIEASKPLAAWRKKKAKHQKDDKEEEESVFSGAG